MGHVPTRPEDGPLKTSVEELVGLLGKPHMISLLYVVGRLTTPPVRFSEIQAHMRISPTTLSERLKDAVEAGLLQRVVHDENPPRVEYAPTQNAQDLLPAFIALNQWCRDHELRPVDAPGRD